MKTNWFFTASVLLLLLPAVARAETFEVYCHELNASPEKNLPSPYKAVWDGSTLTQIAADSEGKISQSSEKVISARRMSSPDDKGLRYSFVTRIQNTSKNKFLSNITIEPTNNPDDFVANVSYATVDSDGFLIYAFEVVNEKCSFSMNAATAPAAPAATETPAAAPPAAIPVQETPTDTKGAPKMPEEKFGWRSLFNTDRNAPRLYNSH